jgi:hypothetical protein
VVTARPTRRQRVRSAVNAEVTRLASLVVAIHEAEDSEGKKHAANELLGFVKEVGQDALD